MITRNSDKRAITEDDCSSGCKSVTLVGNGLACQLPTQLQSGVYRVLLWIPQAGLASTMPFLTVTSRIVAVSPKTSAPPPPNIQLFS